MADSLTEIQKTLAKLTQDTISCRREKKLREREKAAERKREESQNRASQGCSAPTLKRISLQDYSARITADGGAVSGGNDCQIRLN